MLPNREIILIIEADFFRNVQEVDLKNACVLKDVYVLTLTGTWRVLPRAKHKITRVLGNNEGKL